MDNTVLVDSCVFITLLKDRRDPNRTLFEWAAGRQLATCGMVKMEVLRGLKEPTLHKKIKRFLDVFIYVPTNNKLWEQATELAWQLDRKGIVLPAQDILIATCALHLGAAVLSFDQHFQLIPNLKVYDKL
ncbi:MAG: PIN domain-containing protein [Verrucomicrobiota bacterium]|nr:PIN domain-containing protein [Verrucomicrobiota bacterium]